LIPIFLALNLFLKIGRTAPPSEEKRPIPSAQALMMDKMFFLSVKVEEFHFYRLIVGMSLDMVFDVEASGRHAVIRSAYAVGPFRVHMIPSQAGRGDNPYSVSAILI
jgi:hypothetical protein